MFVHLFRCISSDIVIYRIWIVGFLWCADKKAYEEAAKRLKIDAEMQDKLIPRLRVESRRKYLEKRKEDKVQELEADIIDDEYLFNEDE